MSWLRTIAGCVALCAVGAGLPLIAQMTIAEAMLARERGAPALAVVRDGGSGVAEPPTSLEAALRAAFASAGVIFTGEVVAIDHAPGAVIVRWRVEDAVRGVGAGAIYEQKEWPGLWAGGDARHRVGERALVLLHAPSVGGYASPVADGVVPLRGDAVTGTLDLRWMAQTVAVTDAARLQPMLSLRDAGGDLTLRDALLARAAQNVMGAHVRALHTTSMESGRATVLLPSPMIVPADDPNEHVDGAMIVGMLHAWQRAGL